MDSSTDAVSRICSLEEADDADADAGGACAPDPEASLCAVGGAEWSGIVGGGR